MTLKVLNQSSRDLIFLGWEKESKRNDDWGVGSIIRTVDTTMVCIGTLPVWGCGQGAAIDTRGAPPFEHGLF